MMFPLSKLRSLGVSRKVLKASSRLLSWSSDLAVSRVVNTSPMSRQSAFGSAEASRAPPQLHHAAKDTLPPGRGTEPTSPSLPPPPPAQAGLGQLVPSTPRCELCPCPGAPCDRATPHTQVAIPLKPYSPGGLFGGCLNRTPPTAQAAEPRLCPPRGCAYSPRSHAHLAGTAGKLRGPVRPLAFLLQLGLAHMDHEAK